MVRVAAGAHALALLQEEVDDEADDRGGERRDDRDAEEGQQPADEVAAGAVDVRGVPRADDGGDRPVRRTDQSLQRALLGLEHGDEERGGGHDDDQRDDQRAEEVEVQTGLDPVHVERDPTDDGQLANRPERPSEDPCHTGADVSHRKTFGRSAIGTVWRRAGRRDKGVPGAARIGLAVGTMPGWPCCATPRSPPSTATSTTRRAGSRGPSRPTSCTRWSTPTSARSAPTCSAGGCTRRCATGRPPPATCPARWASTPGSGGRPTRSSTPPASRTSRRPAPGSPRRSTRPRSRPSRPRACSTSASAARPSRPRRSAPAWSTTCTCSCTRCSSVVAPGRCPTTVHAALDLVSVDRVGDVVHLHHRVRH